MGLALVHMKRTALPLAWTSLVQYKCIRDGLRDISRHSSSSVKHIVLGYLECLHCLCLCAKILEAYLTNSHVSQEGGSHGAIISHQYPGSVSKHITQGLDGMGRKTDNFLLQREKSENLGTILGILVSQGESESVIHTEVVQVTKNNFKYFVLKVSTDPGHWRGHRYHQQPSLLVGCGLLGIA